MTNSAVPFSFLKICSLIQLFNLAFCKVTKEQTNNVRHLLENKRELVKSQTAKRSDCLAFIKWTENAAICILVV